MKKIFLLLIGICVFFVSCASIPNGYKSIPDVPYMYENYDDFKDVSFIFHEEMFYPRDSKIYIGKRKDSCWLRITFNYSGNNWIFFKNATFVNKSSDRISFNINSWDRKDTIHNGTVSEYVDILLTDDNANNLYKVFSGSDIKLRLSGDYYHDYQINDEDYIKGIKETLEYYFNIKK